MSSKENSRRWVFRLFQRRLIVSLLIIIQAGILIYFAISSSRQSKIVDIVFRVLSFMVILQILNTRIKSAFKMTWMLLILSFPVLGVTFYILHYFQTEPKKLNKAMNIMEGLSRSYYDLSNRYFEEAVAMAPQLKSHLYYLDKTAHFPVYRKTQSTYLSPGEVKFEALLEQLEKAERYIFLEYFIIEEGIMWDNILTILKDKAAAGVDVRLMYDDIGCFLLLPKDYPEQMESYGIQCVVFNPFKPFLTTIQNNRDHRKIVVIDGKVAFTGGNNLADEYINAYPKYGHWKDASIMVEGEAAWSFTMMFLQMWSSVTGVQENFESFYPWQEEGCPTESDGLVLPYADSPLDYENVGEHVYLQIINNAKNYLYINTPYLIVDENMISALILAAKSGVDVRIVTPHKADKHLVHLTTRSFYRSLIASGVRIYEYSEGFMHSKTFVSDDEVATVGTTNLDYRSLYLHFECGVWLYKTQSTLAVRDDFLSTLDLCEEITLEKCQNNMLVQFIQDVLRVIAPLL